MSGNAHINLFVSNRPEINMNKVFFSGNSKIKLYHPMEKYPVHILALFVLCIGSAKFEPIA